MKTIVPIALFFLFFLPGRTLHTQIVNIEERRITSTNDTTYWYGSVRMGVHISKVKDQVLRLNATAQVQYKKDRLLTLLLLNGNFLRAGNQDFDKKAFAHLRFSRKLTGPLVAEAFLQARYNKLLLIELRALAGAGLRVRLLKSADGKQRIYFGGASLYESNQFTDGLADRQWHRFSSYISFTFRPWEKSKIVNTTYYQPAWTDFGNYRLATEWRLDTSLGRKISFFTDFTLSTDHSLPVEAPTVTYAWLNGLAFKL